MQVGLKAEVMSHENQPVYNSKLPMKLKQGQVETQGRVSADFKGFALIPRDLMEELNTTITAKGAKKMAILTAIKDFKKGIYRLQWENQGHDMKASLVLQCALEWSVRTVCEV